MALFPLTSSFEGDFVLQLVAVDSENTMDEVAAAAAVHSVGRRVRARPDCVAKSASVNWRSGNERPVVYGSQLSCIRNVRDGSTRERDDAHLSACGMRRVIVVCRL